MSRKALLSSVALGRAVRDLRTERGISQEALGDLGNLHRNYIGGVERGEINPTITNVAKVAEALGVRTSELIERAEQFS